eukprot:TRINITY_DN30274_c0_g1_i1.p1 TRINITY_DN30274_c0_g1~~TRINITY_DN30274_c0_g1_i1.p1  ORF type:complete len:319 (+),score=80.44 TRINITY_DN30274_c0_g1_i1:32-988(+)
MGCLCVKPHIEEIREADGDDDEDRSGLVIALVCSTRIRDVDSERRYLQAVTGLEPSEGASYADVVNRMEAVAAQTVASLSFNQEFDPFTARYTPDNHVSGGLVGVGVVIAVDAIQGKTNVQGIGGPDAQKDIIRWLKGNGWGENSVTVLMEEPGLMAPTAENIKTTLKKAVSCCADAVWVSYSGYCRRGEGDTWLVGCDGEVISWTELRQLFFSSSGTVVNLLFDLVHLPDSHFPPPPLYPTQYHRPANLHMTTEPTSPAPNPEDELFTASARLQYLKAERDHLLAATADLRSQLADSTAELSKIQTLLNETSPDTAA